MPDLNKVIIVGGASLQPILNLKLQPLCCNRPEGCHVWCDRQDLDFIHLDFVLLGWGFLKITTVLATDAGAYGRR